MDRIANNLYIGSSSEAHDSKKLNLYEIDYCIGLTSHLETLNIGWDLYLEDNSSNRLLHYIEPVILCLIKLRAGKKILLHSGNSYSRASAIATILFSVLQDVKHEEAYKEIYLRCPPARLMNKAHIPFIKETSSYLRKKYCGSRSRTTGS